MPTYTERDRVELAFWLQRNAHRYARGQTRARIVDDVDEQRRRARARLWAAARKLRDLEGRSDGT